MTTKDFNGLWRIKTNIEMYQLRINIINSAKVQRLSSFEHRYRIISEIMAMKVYKSNPISIRSKRSSLH